jgi:hypothetical protein
MYALAEFHPYFLSGLVIDNNPLTPNLWPGKLEQLPDYLLVARRAGLNLAGLGSPVAGTRDLQLYHAAGVQLSDLQRMENDLRTAENSNPKKVLLIGQPGWKP